MAAKPLMILHAANLQLDCPLRGTGPLQDELREIVDVATLTAFDRIVSLAIEKDVDALLITGNTFDARCPSLVAEVALREGLQRLAERQIPVFVTPGEMDPAAAWDELPCLGENVTVFTDVQDAPVDLVDQGRLLATLLPVTAETSIEPQELANILGRKMTNKADRPFIIGLLLGNDGIRDPHVLTANRFAALDWLACPAGPGTAPLPLTDGHIHRQGAPQGLRAAEAASHGVTLLEVDSQRRTRRIPWHVAPVRWEQLTQKIDGLRGQDDLLERMLSQLESLPDRSGEQVRIISWKLDRSTGATHGWESDDAVRSLGAALTELTDQADGLRYIHRIQAIEPDLTLVEPAHREVLTEFLLALERRPEIDRAAIAKWMSDAGVSDVLPAGRWEHWTSGIGADVVKERARKLGWKWFMTSGAK